MPDTIRRNRSETTRAGTPLRARLRIGRGEVVLETDTGQQIRHCPAGLDHPLEERLWELERARRRDPDEIAQEPASSAGGGGEPGLHGRLLTVGKLLGNRFLDGAAGVELARLVKQVTKARVTLELALEVDEAPLADLPWETLTLPRTATPLVLRPRVELYRSIGGLDSISTIRIPGPLRILVAIASPDQANQPDELLDYEAELAQLLDAVNPVRRRDRAYVRILNRGTMVELHQALQAQRFHVLHFSCHAHAGVLVLEDEDGEPDLVDAEQLAATLLAAGGVPLVVLSGCATALAERQVNAQTTGSAEEGESALPGLARQLLRLGIPAVVAMTAPVTDQYATQLGAELYRELGGQERPDPLGALSEARRRVEARRRRLSAGSPLAWSAEWATPTLCLRGASLPLFDRTAPFEPVHGPPERQLAPVVVVPEGGDFVGRRREQRLLQVALRDQRAVLIHGIGGVGKSTLAAQLIANLGEEAGLVVALSGTIAVDQVLDGLGRRLLAFGREGDLQESDPLRALIPVLRDPWVPWSDRLELLDAQLLNRHPLLLVLDNFEDNLVSTRGKPGFALRDAELADFLTTWIHTPGMQRLLITSRYPFPLPRHAERRLAVHHLGPLSAAEARKLFWRLPALDALPPAEQQRAYADVGGHPRTLEYLDALLRGQARFADVADRMKRALDRREIHHPHRWLRGRSGELDVALAEAITLAVDDVLLGQLLDQLTAVPLARQLLLGASVYRIPVDDIGVAWQVAEETQSPADPERVARFRALSGAFMTALAEGRASSILDLGLADHVLVQFYQDLAALHQPPLRVPDKLREALRLLTDLGLLAPLDPTDSADDESRFLVHRWTARALAKLVAAPDLVEAHRRAARYWNWRVRSWLQSRQDAIEQLLEARFHYHAAWELDAKPDGADLEAAVEAAAEVASQLTSWGAWAWAERLCEETLTWLAPRSGHAARFQAQIGQIAQRQGDDERAQDLFRQSLAIFEELDDQDGVAAMYHHLGMIAHRRRDYEQALDSYRKSLAMAEQLGDKASMATSYSQLGGITFDQEHHEQALGWYRKALAIFEELGDQTGMATTYHQLGVVTQDQGAYEDALEWYQRALALFHALDDQVNLATTYHQLGMLAQSQTDYKEALDWYRQSLAIREEFNDRANIASSLSQIGILLTELGTPEHAVPYSVRSLRIRQEMDSEAMVGALIWLERQKKLLGADRFRRLLRKEFDDETTELVNALLDLFRMFAEKGGRQ